MREDGAATGAAATVAAAALVEGDIIELTPLHRVYADVPKHFVYANRRGDFSMTHAEVTIGSQHDYLAGRYVVTHVAWTGGGMGHDGPHHARYRVYCVKLDESQRGVDFAQEDLPGIAAVGRATRSYSEEQPEVSCQTR